MPLKNETRAGKARASRNNGWDQIRDNDSVKARQAQTYISGNRVLGAFTAMAAADFIEARPGESVPVKSNKKPGKEG